MIDEVLEFSSSRPTFLDRERWLAAVVPVYKERRHRRIMSDRVVLPLADHHAMRVHGKQLFEFFFIETNIPLSASVGVLIIVEADDGSHAV